MAAIDTHHPAEASPRAIRSAHASVTAGRRLSAPSVAGAPARMRPGLAQLLEELVAKPALALGYGRQLARQLGGTIGVLSEL